MNQHAAKVTIPFYCFDTALMGPRTKKRQPATDSHDETTGDRLFCWSFSLEVVFTTTDLECQALGSRSPSEVRINELGEGQSLYMTILSGG